MLDSSLFRVRSASPVRSILVKPSTSNVPRLDIGLAGSDCEYPDPKTGILAKRFDRAFSRKLAVSRA